MTTATATRAVTPLQGRAGGAQLPAPPAGGGEVIDVTAEPAAAAASAVRPQPPQPAGGLGRLAAALAKAQARCKAAAHDARNEHHNYDYTSAEAIIATAKEALAGTGLALIPVSLSVDGHETRGEARFEMCRHFLLAHESGEAVPVSINWPVVPERGRPLDKATAIATTATLAYYLRDLLQMPRVAAGDDLAARDDRRAEPAPAAAPPIHTPATPSQVARIWELARDLGLPDDATGKRLRAVGGEKGLTSGQAADLIGSLEAKRQARAKEAAAGMAAAKS